MVDMGAKTRLKEAVASQRRHWVRLTKVCNNRCLFCLDKENQDKTCVPFETIHADLARGRQEGAVRAILSGGEPTVHPRFHDAVAEASRRGYERIQVVTNGRMFAYKDFLDHAIDAGLHETTFSMHGHTPALHDRLTNVRGSFAQALRGLLAALERGLIVNVDVVLNRLNLPVLPDVLDFFIHVGIKEFDLLQIVPFGLAWENRELLFFDPEEYRECLHGALERGRRPDVFVWTNRLRAEYLEGYEDFIQSPVKLYDEVRGREDMFRAWLVDGSLPPCRGERCRWCFMESFCREMEHVLAGGDGLGGDDTPPCLAPASPLPWRRTLTLRGNGAPADLAAFTEDFIRHGYRVKSFRCRTCPARDDCPGAPIERIRKDGFQILQPCEA